MPFEQGFGPHNGDDSAQQLADGTLARELGLPKGVNFAGLDLNMGCPQKNEVKNGTCAALINNRPLRDQMGRAGREYVLREYNWNAVENKLRAALEKAECRMKNEETRLVCVKSFFILHFYFFIPL